MTNAPRAILIIDDDAAIQRSLSAALAPTYAVRVAATGEEGLTSFEDFCPDIVLLDVMLPQMTGIAVLRALKRLRSDLPVIMMTAFAEVQTAVQAIKLGAVDYLEKPIDPDGVLAQIRHVIGRAGSKPGGVRGGVIGASTAMRRVWRLVESFGPTDIPVLLQGETGTGKGVVAEAVHRISKRAQGQFVAIDCATIPEQLAESELFGYEDGAFTGAGKRKRGRVAFAEAGTLFLDEIGTLALGTQAKLLTLIEQQNFVPLGARNLQPTHLDVRFIGATNIQLQRAVDQGTFRADLFHRLNGVTIELPPLREREGDIELLARHFIAEFAKRHGKSDLDLADDALAAMRCYGWPGNVRELQRVLSAAIVLADRTVTIDDLPQHLRLGAETATGVPPGLPVGADSAITAINLREIKEWAGREAQRRVIEELRQRTNITHQEMARMLGVDPKTLRSRLKDTPRGQTR